METRDSDSLAEFWQRALSLGKSVQNYANTLMHDATKGTTPEVVNQINNASKTLTSIVSDTSGLRDTVEHAHGTSLQDVQTDTQQTFTNLLQQLKEQFPSSDRIPSHTERLGNVSLVLDMVETAFYNLTVHHGVSEQQLQVHLDPILEHVKDVVVTLGLFSCPVSQSRAHRRVIRRRR